MTYEIWTSGDDNAEVTMCRSMDKAIHDHFQKYHHVLRHTFEASSWNEAKVSYQELMFPKIEIESEV